MEKYKKVKRIIKAEKVNMGGIILDQALPVRDIENIDPFLLIHHWKSIIKGGQKQESLGVGPHPHRGFSPVTLVFKGGVHHRDSIGNSSIVRQGGTQWMDSGSGIIHSERPVKELAEKGGDFELIQFWVNSPSKHKMKEPSYQELKPENTPRVLLEGTKSEIRVVAGDYNEIKGPVKTITPMLVLILDLNMGEELLIPVKEGFNSLIYILNGNLQLNKSKTAADKDLIMFNESGNSIHLSSKSKTMAILLAGEPILEEVFNYGPFVMNNKDEISIALNDYQSGKMGVLDEKFD